MQHFFVALLLLSIVGICPNNVLASHNHEDDEFLIGWKAYETGSYEKAIEHWLPLAGTGHVSAQLNLGTLYDYGMGTTVDKSQAAYWYTQAAQQGNQAAQYNLGMMYYDGEGVEQDFSTAFYWYQKAAQNGLANAQYSLGMLYQKGLGVTKSLSFSSQWFYHAALSFQQKGDTSGLNNSVRAIQQINPKHEYLEKLAKAGIAVNLDSRQNRQTSANTYTSIGTGWPLQNGYVITNNHVVADGDDVILVNSNGEQIPGFVALRDQDHDVALIIAKDLTKLPAALPLSHAPADLGTSVFTIGFPRIDVLGTDPKLSDGAIISNSGLGGDPEKYQITVPIQGGNSGGPLINMQGEVVGLITSMLGVRNTETGEEEPLSNIAFALKIEIVRELLTTVDTALNIDELPSRPETLATLAGQIQNSVLMVMAR